MGNQSINIEISDSIVTTPTLYLYIKENRFSASSLVKLLNAIESLLYEGIISSIRKIQGSFPGVHNGVGGMRSVSFQPLKESGKTDDYEYLESIESKFSGAYRSFLINKCFYGTILECPDKNKNKELRHDFIDEIIRNKFWDKPCFDYKEFIEFLRSYSKACLFVDEIHTGNSLEIFFDYATIASIITLPNYPVIDNIARFFIDKLRQGITNKLNPNSSENEIISVLIDNDRKEIIVHDSGGSSASYDIVIKLGPEEFVHYKKNSNVSDNNI